MQHKEPKGYFTIAQNSATGDYLRMAYAQALSIKLTQKHNRYAVAVDVATKELITEQHRRVFDYIIDIPDDSATNDAWKLSNEPKSFWLTPFKETIKVECDILFGRNIDHWWNGYQHMDVFMPTTVYDYRGNQNNTLAYRSVFAANDLPNVYTGMMYFRYSKIAADFFVLARTIYDNWPWYRDQLLKNHKEDQWTTDVGFALAGKILGAEHCTCPALNAMTFVHMKGAVQGWAMKENWMRRLFCEIDETKIKIGFNNQMYPVHYQRKEFITDELIDKYEFQFRRNSQTT